jgi:hypothetical protein
MASVAARFLKSIDINTDVADLKSRSQPRAAADRSWSALIPLCSGGHDWAAGICWHVTFFNMLERILLLLAERNLQNMNSLQPVRTTFSQAPAKLGPFAHSR